MNMRRITKMWVVTVDEQGKEKDGHWVDIPEPDHFPSDGFAQIEGYVSRLLRSSARFTSVIISTPDGQIAVSLHQRGGVSEFSLSVDWRADAARETAIRQLFTDRRLATSHDYLAGNGGVPDATRYLSYLLPPDALFITALTKEVLSRIYRVDGRHALNFSFRDHHDAA